MLFDNMIASLVHPVRFEQRDEGLFLRDLPAPLPDPLTTTLVLEVEEKPEPVTVQNSFGIPEKARTEGMQRNSAFANPDGLPIEIYMLPP